MYRFFKRLYGRLNYYYLQLRVERGLTVFGTAVTFLVPTDSRTLGTVFRLDIFHYNFVSRVYLLRR